MNLHCERWRLDSELFAYGFQPMNSSLCFGEIFLEFLYWLIYAKKLYFLKIVSVCMPLVETKEDLCIPITVNSGSV